MPRHSKKPSTASGESIAQGLTNLLHDLKQGHVSMTDESVFEVGKNVATTEGAVVFENEFFQLLEYKPLTAKVYEKPFLLVPPCINKFYILDLQPENSLIRYAVSEGHRTFVVSWRNPDESMAGKTWDDYIEHAAIKAIDVVQEITGARTLNALGFCVGGTILGTALSVLAARGKKPVASATLLTSFLDFTDTGILDIFIDETSVKYREAEMGQGGLLKGQDLASTFSFLRPNDLVWNYVVGNYLKGETPPPFDLLYWNSDSTNLPGPFYAWYLRNTYFENNLIKPGKAVVCGQKVDLRKVDIPVYIYGSREDHIVPIGGAYASTQYLPGKKRFVMGASGHIAGVINPPAKKKRSYWTQRQTAARQISRPRRPSGSHHGPGADRRRRPEPGAPGRDQGRPARQHPGLDPERGVRQRPARDPPGGPGHQVRRRPDRDRRRPGKHERLAARAERLARRLPHGRRQAGRHHDRRRPVGRLQPVPHGRDRRERRDASSRSRAPSRTSSRCNPSSRPKPP
jgi:class I poly(R)-hydroxyalkanoic acid synthase